MGISKIRIKNFRCFQDFHLAATERSNIILGANNVGKTSLLDALDKVLGRGWAEFALDDFYAASPTVHPEALPVIQIDITLVPDVAPLNIGSTPSSKAMTFSPGLVSDLQELIEIDPASRNQSITLRTEARWDVTEKRIRTDFFSVKGGGARPIHPKERLVLRSFFPFYRASAFRDIVSELRNRRSYWGRILDSVVVNPVTSTEVQQSIAEMNRKVRASAPLLDDLESRFREVGRVIRLDSGADGVVLNPVPVQLDDVLRSLEVLLRVQGSPRAFQLERHGEGTRSIAYLTVFRAFVGLIAMIENENTEARPILGVEEPEVHLHPHAVRGVSTLVTSENHQTFLTTHSPELARLNPGCDLVALQRRAGDIVASRLPGLLTPGAPVLTPAEREHFERTMATTGSSVLFGRATILVEGASERWAIPILAKAIGTDLDEFAISLAEVGGSGYRVMMKALRKDAFAVPWVIISDGDNLQDLAHQLLEAGYITQATLDTASTAGRIREDVLLTHDCFVYDLGWDFERLMVESGSPVLLTGAIDSAMGSGTFERYVRDQEGRTRGFAALAEVEQLRTFFDSPSAIKNKPHLARAIAETLTSGGTVSTYVPSIIRDAVVRARDLADELRAKAW